MIKIYTDAAVKGNPGDAGIGLLIITDKDQHQLAIPLKEQFNNHQAEFIAIIHGLQWLIDNDYNQQFVFCYTDSQIVAQSIEKKYAKDSVFSELLNNILNLMSMFKFISIEWIPESKNKGADNLAKQALRTAMNKPS